MLKLALLMATMGCVGCGGDMAPSGSVLNLLVTSHDIVVGQTTSIAAYFDDGTGATPVAVSATWSVDPSGIVTLSDLGGNYQKVTAVGAGSVIVTADALDQTVKTGFTVTAQ